MLRCMGKRDREGIPVRTGHAPNLNKVASSMKDLAVRQVETSTAPGKVLAAQGCSTVYVRV